MSVGRLALVTVIVGVALVAGLESVRSLAPAAGAGGGPPYVFVTGQTLLWRANPATGEVSFCAPITAGRDVLAPRCSPWVGGPPSRGQ
ncbi:MAG TPA: hypothetical protein VFG47_16495 [Geminicoccaceae bacterium]|nr:hypothetical protein [Geminicoccaceae bacterium]